MVIIAFPMRALLLAATPLLAGGCLISSNPPKAYEDLDRRARDEIHRENYAAARARLQELLQRYPDRPSNQEAELLLSGCEFRLGNEAQAQAIRERVAREAATGEIKVRALAGLGEVELAAEEFEAAAARLQEAARLETDGPQRARLLLRRGRALQQGGRFAEARAVLREAVELSPDSSTARRAQEALREPDHFSVQTSAFVDASKAERQRELLVKHGFPAEVFAGEYSRGRFHCVRVGPLKDRAAARAMRERIAAAKLLPESAKLVIRP